MSDTRRKLTTIFSADVQGYSKLMEADEEGTLSTLKRYRDAMARLIEAHGGRVINTWGDGLLAEFPSVVEAVRAAIDVQNELAGYNANRAAEARMLFRIGINLGDVMVDGDDIYGDGVNIAARLQTSAPPGGIVISSTVYDQVRNKLAVGFEFLGQLPVKNIDEGVPSYAVRIGERGERHEAGKSQWGRQSTIQEAPDIQTPLPATSMSPSARNRVLCVFGVVALGLLAINLLSWGGELWARWPVFALAVTAALLWLRANSVFDRTITMLALAGITVVGVNLLSWHGEFWARWPLLGLAIAAGIRWAARHRASESRRG
ncbi:MAG TPA: adenylate/guanylate cyclase domain-containing protein [Rhizobiaceae bacterium]|nr:adenylate/guanylate cyclase domain-containing protein [Rhizobiaceae bacterium]